LRLFQEKDLENDFGVPAYLLWKQATLGISQQLVGDKILS